MWLKYFTSLVWFPVKKDCLQTSAVLLVGMHLILSYNEGTLGFIENEEVKSGVITEC